MKIIHIPAVCIFFAIVAQNAWAGVSLSQTRLVFSHSENMKTITVRNSGAEVYLVQPVVAEWGEGKLSKSFTAFPPIFRLESNASNALRVQRTSEDLPQDRESLFNFKLNLIPAGKKNDSATSISVSLGIGVKLFYRPDGLTISVKDAYRMLTFRRDAEGVTVGNPTPYYQTLSRLSVGGLSVKLDKSPAMLPPYSERHYPAGLLDNKAEWSLINDYGASSEIFHAAIN
jgi:P pilus assembly chaperone PapD